MSLTPVANGKIFNQKNLHYFFWTPLGGEVIIWKKIFFKFILSCQQADNWSHCLPPVSFTLVANLSPAPLTPVANLPLVSLPPVSTTLAKLVAKFAVVDTGGAL